MAYWIIGYPFAFGGNPNVILGTRFWASEQFGALYNRPGVDNFTNSNNVYNLNNQDPYIHFFYQYMITFLVTNIAASAFAERCQIIVYVLFSILMSGRRDFFRRNILIYMHFCRIRLSIPCTLDVGCKWLAWLCCWCTGKLD